MLQTECGYTPKQIEEMTFADVERLNAHWKKHPPLRVLVSCVAASLGVKFPKPADTSKAASKLHPGGALVLMFPDGRIRM